MTHTGGGDSAVLQRALENILPGARLQATPLPALPALRLQLLGADFPQAGLSPEAMLRVMDNPLYWTFCWASGQVLAGFLTAQPAWVRGRRVLDFGCGSGVAGIAAARAGAAEVIACDCDPLALAATRVNAALNGVELTLCDDFDRVDGELDLIIVADVLYDRANFAWLDRFVARAGQVLVADSRVRDFAHRSYRLIGRQQAGTVPDLDESPEYRDVRIYCAG
jgi:predicted nicotinamide N-methyase